MLESRNLLSAAPQLLKDINATINAPSNATEFTTVGTITYFVADDGVHGSELWKTNGNAAGTVMVRDLFLGKERIFSRSLNKCERHIILRCKRFIFRKSQFVEIKWHEQRHRDCV
jgi:ELWxxDGT repeat protein